jgi:hypothetical protein
VKQDLRHFDIPEPLLVGMSGGRTSAYQLLCFLDLWDGKVTGRRRVCFANTGDEDERTLKFVERISLEWGVEIDWLEYRFEPFPVTLTSDPEFQELRRRQFRDRKDKSLRKAVATRMVAAGFADQAVSILKGRETLNGRSTYAVVNYATASRAKEPYSMMLEAKEAYRRDVKGKRGVVPCPAQRMCTGDLKMKVLARHCMHIWGLKRAKDFNVALALRAEEIDRVDSALARDPEGGVPYFPLADAGVNGIDVMRFWKSQPFDLGMKSYEGNCRLCFMKKKAPLIMLIRQRPEDADWWSGWEERTNDRFRRDRIGYSGMKYEALHQANLFPEPDDMESVITCEGGYCSD